MTFLYLISILFGSRGRNGRLLYCGVQDQYYIETRTDDLFYFSFQFSLGAGAGTGGCSTVGCRINTTLKPEQMTFLFLISILFGSRGRNGWLLYFGVQDQYYIETRTDDLFYFSFQFSSGAGVGMCGCCTAGCRTTTLISEQMTFLLLNSILFGGRGGNGRLLYSGVQY